MTEHTPGPWGWLGLWVVQAGFRAALLLGAVPFGSGVHSSPPRLTCWRRWRVKRFMDEGYDSN